MSAHVPDMAVGILIPNVAESKPVPATIPRPACQRRFADAPMSLLARHPGRLAGQPLPIEIRHQTIPVELWQGPSSYMRTSTIRQDEGSLRYAPSADTPIQALDTARGDGNQSMEPGMKKQLCSLCGFGRKDLAHTTCQQYRKALGKNMSLPSGGRKRKDIMDAARDFVIWRKKQHITHQSIIKEFETGRWLTNFPHLSLGTETTVPYSPIIAVRPSTR